MSKRFGNTLTARDLREEGVDAAAVRMLCYSTHYRQRLNFTDDALEAAREGIGRLGELRNRLSSHAGDLAKDGPGQVRVADELRVEFEAALDDDLNAPRALAAVFSFVRDANRQLDDGSWDAAAAAAALGVLNRVVDVLDLFPTSIDVSVELSRWIEDRLEAREAARAAHDYATADQIRAELAGRGIDLEDTAQGTRWKLRSD